MAGEIYRGNTAIEAIYRGNTAVSNVYRGNVEVWSAAPSFDTDAQAFFTQIEDVEGISLTTTEKDAVNQLVLDLKADSIWTKMDALYPFVGSDADACKYNLKDPQDTDGAYRITMYGTNTFNSDGFTPGSTNSDFGLTHISPDDYSGTPSNGTHMSVWANTVNNVRGYDMGVFRGSGVDRDDWCIIISFGNSTQYACFETLNYATDSHTPAENFYMSNNTGTSTQTVRGSSAQTSVSQTIASHDWLGRTVAIGGSYRGGTTVADGTHGRGYAFASSGLGLDATEISNFYDAVNTFVTALSR